jgi:NAD-dependent dihydropyrimidine dehydrogenase PreA subunit
MESSAGEEATRGPDIPVTPIVDRNKCEGKEACVRVCPESVFEVRKMDPADFARLPFLGKLKSQVHGRQTAYTPNADACRGCGLCVTACPEGAIQLVAGQRGTG